MPSPVAVRCYLDIGEFTNYLADCDTELDSVHGTAVAEAVIDIAPEVSLYLSTLYTAGDMRDAVDWMISEGVDVINTSLGFTWDGPGDGTSPFDDGDHYSPLNTVDRGVAGGAVWATAAGNEADSTWFATGGSLPFNSAGYIEFVPSEIDNCFIVRPGGRFIAQLRWEDTWGGATRDLDLYLWDPEDEEIKWASEDVQSGDAGHFPHEYFSLVYSGEAPKEFCLRVRQLSGSQPDWMQLQEFVGLTLDYYTELGSMGSPAESANPGMLAVGAAHYFDTHTTAFYSSRGPTPDGRIKPDIVGTDCAATASYEVFNSPRLGGNDCWFPGTSQASPHVAGMAALVKQRFRGYTPDQVADYLKHYAEQREAPDPNNTWGHGFAVLPRPDDAEPAPGFDTSCGQTLTADGPVSGQWTTGCNSGTPAPGEEGSGARLARYYTFELAQPSDVTITLESSIDTYLYLRDSDDRSGDVAADRQNDDIDTANGNYNSQLRLPLPAGNYTIEATTYEAGQTGRFTLAVSGLGGGTGPAPDACAATEIVADGETPGQWAAGCESEVREGSYARYYTFTLAQQSEVTITLRDDTGDDHDTDPYLVLRREHGRTGEIINNHVDDDDAGGGSDGRDSQAVETLDAGNYTIEATTYTAGQTGDFTLTVSGLGGGTGPAPDACVETITADGPVTGSWAAGCDSAVAERGHARYYTFTLPQPSDVTITLESSIDTFLYLCDGDARSGAFRHENDDIESGNTNSRIAAAALPAGKYTIEATTYAAGQTGNFTLTVTGIGGGTGPAPDACGEDLGTLTADITRAGAWAAGCDSAVAERGHARYYTFELAQPSDVTITLESSIDTYLYLRDGDARSGDVAADRQNDDIDTANGNYNSQLRLTLPAGKYTIETTTYAEDKTGDFTLTVTASADPAALVALYNATGGANWTNNSGWLTDAPIG